MQYYLLLPILLVIVPVRYLKGILAGGIILCVIYAGYLLNSDGGRQDAYFSLLARIPEFLIGVWISVSNYGQTWSRGVSNGASTVGIMLVLGSFFLINDKTSFPGAMALPPCVGTAMIIAAKKGWINRFVSQNIFVWIGALSYSLYLWHWPILSIIRYYTNSYELDASSLAFVLISTLLCACFSYYCVENIFRKSNSKKKVIFHAGMLIISIFPVIIASFKLNQYFIDSLPREYTRYAVEDEICHGKIVRNCVRGSIGSQNKLLLLGDSHAAQLNKFAAVVGNANNIEFTIVTASSCVTIPNFDTNVVPDFSRKQCLNQLEYAEELIKEAEIIVIAGKWSWHVKSDTFLISLDNFLADVNTSGKSIFLLAQIPQLELDIQRLRIFERLGFPVQTKLIQSWETANQKVAAITDKYSNTIFLDFTALPFFDNAPFYDGDLMYFDESHLNEVGSAKYGEMVVPYFKDMLN